VDNQRSRHQKHLVFEQRLPEDRHELPQPDNLLAWSINSSATALPPTSIPSDRALCKLMTN
jgi:hypothetical protein